VRKPDLTIGNEYDPYLYRWWVIPRNRIFNIYLHQFKRSDHDVLHDHPWWFNISILLKGTYTEMMTGGRSRVLSAPCFKLRIGCAPHSVQLTHGDVWTLFITGPKYRIWGFLCPKGWLPFYEFKKYQPAISGQVVDDRGQCP